MTQQLEIVHKLGEEETNLLGRLVVAVEAHQQSMAHFMEKYNNVLSEENLEKFTRLMDLGLEKALSELEG